MDANEEAALKKIADMKLKWNRWPEKKFYWAETEHYMIFVERNDTSDVYYFTIKHKVSGIHRRWYANNYNRPAVEQIKRQTEAVDSEEDTRWAAEFVADGPKKSTEKKPELPLGMNDELQDNTRIG